MLTVPGKDGRIAFRRYFDADHTTGAIFTIRPDGSGIRQVTHPPPARLTTEPDWSPDGRWIAYDVNPHGDEDRSRLAVIHPDGTGRTSLGDACVAPCRMDGFPAWSPSGSRIAFQRGLGPRVHHNKVVAIYVMRVDTRAARRVTQRGRSSTVDAPWQDEAPAWSPSGRRIAFERFSRSTDHQAVFTVRTDGTDLRRITPWQLDASQPDYSPDGRWILFRTEESSDTSGNIVLVHPNGSGRHAVTHAVPGRAKWLSASFSPSGAWITAGRYSVVDGEPQNADVFAMRVDGSERRHVTDTPGKPESAPDWGPRG
jgi:Tol biopolymer transport system component